MSFPTITNDCILAVMEKATQKDPYTYSAESIMNMIRDGQVPLAGAITATAEGFAERLTTDIGEDEAFAQTLTVAIVASCLMMYNAVLAQHEAEELAEMFGETPE
jgi:hypothetical protein